MIGYDINNRYVQISYYHNTKSQPESFSTITGSEKFQIPIVLCKVKDRDLWHYGEEAKKIAETGQGVLIDNLFLKCLSGRSIEVEDEIYDGIQLLARFIKKTLRFFYSSNMKAALSSLVFTLDRPDSRAIYILNKVMEQLDIDRNFVSIQSHKDSFYHYMKHQKRELWNHETVLFEYEEEFKCYHLAADHKSIPKRITVTETIYHDVRKKMEEIKELSEENYLLKLDSLFFQVIEKEFKGRNISSVYLIGDSFDRQWMNQSLQLLGRGRRVFQGNNLYTKGACYAAMEQIKGEGEKFLYLKEESESSEILLNLKNQSNNEKRKLKGDYYLKNNQCQNAILEYQKILTDKEELPEELSGDLWNNIGVAYGKLFLYSPAAEAFKKAYEFWPQESVVFNYFCICRLSGGKSMPEEWEDYQPGSQSYKELEERYALLLLDHEKSEAKGIIHKALEDRSKGRILKSYETLETLLNQWKREYRDETI